MNEPGTAAPLVFLKGVWLAMANGFSENSGLADGDRLVCRGGMDSMLYTRWIIIGAVTCGTPREEFGVLTKLISPGLPARMFRVEFQKRGLQPQNLSHLAAGAGTVTSALIPWNSCGAFMALTLGGSTFLDFPFAVFNIASPILSLLYGITGFKTDQLPTASGLAAEAI